MKIITETKRVYFVRPKVSYAKVYTENINNPDIYRWLRSDATRYTILQEKEWIKSIQNETVFTMIDKETKDIVGNIGFNSINDGVGEMGIWITIPYQNKHYGYEAIKEIVDYGFNVMNMKEIVLTVFGTNEKAIKCYENVGFIEDYRESNIKDGFGNITDNIHMKIIK